MKKCAKGEVQAQPSRRRRGKGTETLEIISRCYLSRPDTLYQYQPLPSALIFPSRGAQSSNSRIIQSSTHITRPGAVQ